MLFGRVAFTTSYLSNNLAPNASGAKDAECFQTSWAATSAVLLLLIMGFARLARVVL